MKNQSSNVTTNERWNWKDEQNKRKKKNVKFESDKIENTIAAHDA